MKTGKTPCTIECPAGTDIPAYMEQIREGNWDKAAQIIMRANPFPMLTSRVCPHTCQSKCNQCKNGDSVSIHSAESALEAMGIHFIFHMAVMPGFSRKYPITLRFVSLDQGIQGAEAQQREALDILSRTIHGMEADAQGIWHVPGWKGQICFGKEIGGAFGMDQAPVIPVWER